ncbi:hypothetical protein AHAS_Ahas05G0101100 [Arachis hypogaea]
MLKVDRATSTHSKGCLARILVKINLSKKLILRICVLRSTLNLEYEGLHLTCFNCGVYGHWSESCEEVPVIEEDYRAEVANGKQVFFNGDVNAANKERQEKIMGD